MAIVSPYVKLITLNELNSPIKTINWLNELKIILINILPTRDSFTSKDMHRPKVKGWKKMFHANGSQNKAGVALLISNKIDFKPKTVIELKKVSIFRWPLFQK